jgi:hypothetical protein
MAKVCALSAPGFLLGVFFGFGGLFFRLLCVVVLGGRSKGGDPGADDTIVRPGGIYFGEEAGAPVP